ncbi:MAG: hypothetical protein V9E90_02220 [Saprospiraceae bacterium]|jgi:hypothetical protein
MKKKISKEYSFAVREAAFLVAELYFKPQEYRSLSLKRSTCEKYYKATIKNKKNKLSYLSIHPITEYAFKRNFIILMTGVCAESKIQNLTNFNKSPIKSELNKMADIASNIFQGNKVTQAYINYIIEESKFILSMQPYRQLILIYAKELISSKTISIKKVEEIFERYN